MRIINAQNYRGCDDQPHKDMFQSRKATWQAFVGFVTFRESRQTNEINIESTSIT